MFVIFIVPPYSKNIARGIQKSPKIYFFDTALVSGEGVRFENLVAISLLKHIYGCVDVKAEEYTLNYLRTKEGAEVDFALVKKDQVEQIIEAKVSDDTVSKSLRYFHEKYEYPAVQLVQSLRHERQEQGIEILKAEKFLSQLFL
ncbi:MAG: DUF4143 domain-containing protein [Alphaproteobacteria bacterium]